MLRSRKERRLFKEKSIESVVKKVARRTAPSKCSADENVRRCKQNVEAELVVEDVGKFTYLLQKVTLRQRPSSTQRTGQTGSRRSGQVRLPKVYKNDTFQRRMKMMPFEEELRLCVF